MRIALFGGSFDPPHNSHLKVANEVIQHLKDVDQVWFLPDNQHAWKSSGASAEDRLAMLRLLETDRIKISDVSIQLGGRTYTIDVLKKLEEMTDNTYVFICGADQLKDFDKWKQYQELEEKLHFVVFPRIGYAVPDMLPKNFTLMAPSDFIATDDNSTEIRERVQRGLSISNLVPSKVEEYIMLKKLYA